MKTFTLSEIAETLDLEFNGDGNCVIERIADIGNAKKGSIAFIYSAKYEQYLAGTNASAVILVSDLIDQCNVAYLVAENPRLEFARVANLLYPSEVVDAVIAPSAVIHDTADIADNVAIDDCVVIQKTAKVSADVMIGAGSVLGENVQVGKGTKIYPNVTILDNCEIGENCVLHSGVVIGADGFGFVPDGDTYFKVPQIGRVLIGDNVEIGANTTVDRGAIDDTVIGNGVKLDNQIQVAHNVVIGEHTVISAGTAIAGTTKIGKHCLIGGCVAIRDNIEITDNVVITGRTLVSKSLTRSGSYSSSTPIDDTKNWRKNGARFRSLDSLARRVKQLESLFKNNNDSNN